MSEQLPKGWAWAPLGDLFRGAVFTDGDWVETKDQDPAGPVRLLQLADVGEGEFRDRSDRWLNRPTAERLGCTFLERGDVLVARMPDPLGRACQVPALDGPGVTVVDVCVLRPDRSMIDPTWLMWAINSPQFRSEILALQSGTTRKRISRKNLAKIPVLVPPHAEQQRIVTAIEEHLYRLGAAERSLEDGQNRLGQLLGAVLRKRSEADLRPIGDLLMASNYGTSAKCDYGASGPPVLRIPNVRRRAISTEDMKFACEADEVGQSAYVAEGDVLVVRTNGSRRLIGRTAVVRSPISSLAFASYLIRLQFDPAIVLPEFGSMMLESPQLRKAIEMRAASSAGQYNLSLSKINTLEIPVPDLDAQQKVVDEFSRLEDQSQQVTRALGNTRSHSAALRRSILSAAFSGQLVEQDPSDEPASVLLERIAAEQPAPKGKRRRTSA